MSEYRTKTILDVNVMRQVTERGKSQNTGDVKGHKIQNVHTHISGK